MKLISISAGMLTSKIAAFGAQKTRTHSKKSRCIHNESLFGADFGREASLDPFFFENERGVAVTVNGERYRAMLNEFLFREIEEEDIGGIWFQQDGATCHTANATINLLRTVFEDRIISRNSDIVWPPRSCDLTPLDYYLWGAVKDQCYANKPATIDALKTNIRDVIAEIQPHTIENVLKNWTDRMGWCMASRGSHMNEVVFHH